MESQRIVFLDRASLIAEVRRPAFPHVWQEYAATTPEEVVQRLKGAGIAITNKVPLRREALVLLPELRMIAVAATGTEHVDIACCRERGIAVANIRNYAVHAVPEHAFMLILALRRNLIAYREDLRQGLWRQADQFCLFTHPMRDLYGSTLGIVGYGALGQAVARLGEAFGMRLLVAEHKGAGTLRPGFTAFEQVLQESDVVTLHAPLNAQTRNLIAAPEIALMQTHALLINTARGGLVDERALADALQHGAVGGAGFDVLSEEPPRHGNVLLELSLPNLLLTPHVAWASKEAMQKLADQLMDNIEGFVRGESRNRMA
jgi:glycerate dehydrogenase